MFTENGQSVSYKVRFIDVRIFSNGQARRIEMHSPIMDIDETRELGLQICSIFGRDPSDFVVWCDKVRNDWKENPTLFSSRNIYVSGNDETFGFQTLNTFDNEKPWYINFVITSPQ
jgi:hypothetical protein